MRILGFLKFRVQPMCYVGKTKLGYKPAKILTNMMIGTINSDVIHSKKKKKNSDVINTLFIFWNIINTLCDIDTINFF